MATSARMKLMTDQKLGIKFATSNKYCILAMEPGTGKSLTALETWRRNGAGPLLIVCPSSLVLNWKAEIQKWYGKKKYQISLFQSKKEIYNVWDTDIVITTYDIGKEAKDIFDWAETLILDEGHNLKEISAQRTEFYHTAIYEYDMPRVMLLTGTPIENRVREFYSLMAICYYRKDLAKSDFLKRFPTADAFADYFSWREERKINRPLPNNPYNKFTLVTWSGARNVPELFKYLAPIYFKAKNTDELKLKPIVYKDILMSEVSDKKLAKEYQRLSKMYNSDPEKAKMNSTRKAESALEKVKFTINYIKMLLQERDKVVVFTDHIASCVAIAEAFGEKPLTGEVSGKARALAVQRFINDKSVKVLPCTYAMNAGHNIVVSRDIVLNDEPWVPGRRTQAIKRIHRKGQTKRCTVHRIFGSPQDMKISKKLDHKMKTIAKVT